MTDDRDPYRHLETITPEQWATLPAALRARYSALRQQRGLPPEPVPSTPEAPAPKPFDPKAVPTLKAMADAILGGEDPDGALWQELQAATKSLLDAYRLHTRGPGRPRTVSKQFRLELAKAVLRLWHRTKDRKLKDWNQERVINCLSDDYNITRDEAFRLLREITGRAAQPRRGRPKNTTRN